MAREPTPPRPVIFEFDSIAAYVAAMLAWHRIATPRFSLRGEVKRMGMVSHSQVSRLGAGKRRLTRDLVDPLARLLALTGEERVFLDRWVKNSRAVTLRSPSSTASPAEAQNRGRQRTSQNHLLKDWLNVYVRDVVKLKGFRPEMAQLYRLLGGIASPARISRSWRFLLREGFLRRTLEGNIVMNEVLVTSSDGIPNAKIRAFHKQALVIARRNLDLFPLERRQEAALVLHLNNDSVVELRQLLQEFYARLLQFAEEKPHDNEGLYQVLINFTPISAADNEEHQS